MLRRTVLIGILATSSLAHGASRPRVVATFSVLGDMVKRIAGDGITLAIIVGPDGDTEAHEPTAANARALADADLLVMNGLNPEFEPWLDGLLRQSQFHGVRLVSSDGVRILKKADEGAANAAGAGEIDQHAWHDAANAAVYAENIQAALMKLDPASAETYRTNGDAFRRELLDLDRWAKQRVAQIPAAKRKVISSHDGFAYLARAYGIRIIGARGWTNDKEPSAAQVADLVRQIRQDKIRAIFVENMNDPRLMQRIARETGAEIGGELYSDALSKPGGVADTYVSMFRHNIDMLCAGMAKN